MKLTLEITGQEKEDLLKNLLDGYTYKRETYKHLDQTGQLSLGEIIEKLELVENKEKKVYIGFKGVYLKLDSFSFRGDYSALACSYDFDTKEDLCKETSKAPKVIEVLTYLKSCIGETYEGWKGGEFTMSENTPFYITETPCSSSASSFVFSIDDCYKEFLLLKIKNQHYQ